MDARYWLKTPWSSKAKFRTSVYCRDLITAGSYWLYDRTQGEHAPTPHSGNSQERTSLSVERPSSISPNLWVLNLSIHLAHLPVLLECAYAGARMFVEMAPIANENSANQKECLEYLSGLRDR